MKGLRNDTRVGIAPTARNYLSSYVTAPISFSLDLVPLEPKEAANWLQTASEPDEFALLAILASELAFWYWLSVGDGFHVTKGNMVPLTGILAHLDELSQYTLATLGYRLYRDRSIYWAYKRNAGKYVGSANYSKARAINVRSTLVTCAGLHIPAHVTNDILENVLRRLSINENAGEKGIPPHLHELSAKLASKQFATEPAWFTAYSEPDSFIVGYAGYQQFTGLLQSLPLT